MPMVTQTKKDTNNLICHDPGVMSPYPTVVTVTTAKYLHAASPGKHTVLECEHIWPMHTVCVSVREEERESAYVRT